MKATYANLDFLVAPLEKVKIGEMNFDNIYYLTLYIPKLSFQCHQYKKSIELFYSSFYEPSLQNPVCLQHSSI